MIHDTDAALIQIIKSSWQKERVTLKGSRMKPIVKRPQFLSLSPLRMHSISLLFYDSWVDAFVAPKAKFQLNADSVVGKHGNQGFNF